MLYKNNFYELGMNNLYDSVNAINIWKPIVSHASCLMQDRLYRSHLFEWF